MLPKWRSATVVITGGCAGAFRGSGPFRPACRLFFVARASSSPPAVQSPVQVRAESLACACNVVREPASRPPYSSGRSGLAHCFDHSSAAPPPLPGLERVPADLSRRDPARAPDSQQRTRFAERIHRVRVSTLRPFLHGLISWLVCRVSCPFPPFARPDAPSADIDSGWVRTRDPAADSRTRAPPCSFYLFRSSSAKGTTLRSCARGNGATATRAQDFGPNSPSLYRFVDTNRCLKIFARANVMVGYHRSRRAHLDVKLARLWRVALDDVDSREKCLAVRVPADSGRCLPPMPSTIRALRETARPVAVGLVARSPPRR